MSLPPEKLAEFSRRVQIPPLPQVAHALIEVSADPNCSARDVAAIINVDPALATRLLKVANSSFFAQARAVTTIERATVVLGLNYVKAVALAAQLSAAFVRVSAGGMDMEGFWRDSLLRACIARQLALRARLALAEQAFLCGLTVDFAVPTLANRHGAAYVAQVRKCRGDPNTLFAWERKTLQYTHADVGEAILTSWNLPPILTRPIACHHEPPTTPPSDDGDVTDVHTLCLIAYFVGTLPFELVGDEERPPAPVNAVRLLAEQLQLPAAALGQAIAFANNEFQSIHSLFDQILPENCDIGRAVKEASRVLAEVDPAVYSAAFS